ncbi:pentatricopeptide repeat-containing protein [Canna indica]|uniref:Pentatricopeptide repeat-containing protein n=1 Tax=Canna indica TaxID=4628 RepID=A0AAQ3KIG2_9LILI|nr:pentatricopeptide repeat-containing protein [Canna indica]
MTALLRNPLRSFCFSIADNSIRLVASPPPFHIPNTSPPQFSTSTLPFFQRFSSLLQNLSKSPNIPKYIAALDSTLAGAHLLDSTTSVLLLRGLSQCKKLNRAKAVLSRLERRSAVPDLFLYSLLLHCLLPSSPIRDVELVWHDVAGRRTGRISGASDFVIGLCRRREDALEIEQICYRISRSRWSLSREAYMALIGTLCGRRCPNPSLARTVLREMEEKGFEADELTYFALFQSFCRVGNVPKADSVLRIMVDRWNCELDILIYGNFLHALCKSHKLREARKLFDKMMKKDQNTGLIPVIKPGRRVIFQLSFTGLVSQTMAFGAYFRSLCSTGRVEEAEKLLREGMEKKLPVETCVYSSFIEALFCAGRVEDAMEFLEAKKKKGYACGEVLVSVIAGLCKLGRVDDGYSFLIEMINNGFAATSKVCNSILESYWKAGRVEEAIGLFEGMKAQTFGGCARPDSSTYSLMIHGFLRRGNIVVVHSLLEQMEWEKLQGDVRLHMSVVRYLYTYEKFEEMQQYMNKMIESGSIVSYAELEGFLDSLTTRETSFKERSSGKSNSCCDGWRLWRLAFSDILSRLLAMVDKLLGCSKEKREQLQ